MRFGQILGVIVLLGGAGSTASASLVFQGFASVGAGIGGQPELLEINNALPTAEVGCVARNSAGTADLIGGAAPPTGGCDVTGNLGTFPPSPATTNEKTHTATQLVSAASNKNFPLDRTSQLVIVFDINQGSGNGITLDDLIVKFYNPDATAPVSVVYWAEITAPIVFTGAGLNGSGHGDAVFMLDPTQAQAAAAALAPYCTTCCSTCNLPDNVRIGVEAKAHNALSGNETFFLTNNTFIGFPESMTPEPLTLLTLGTGLLAIAAYRKLRIPKN